MEMEVALHKNDAPHWVYRGEGAVNLVLAYNGSSPLFVGKVLRIQKASRKVAPGSEQWLNGHERLIWKDNPDILSSPSKEIAQQMFVQNVMAPRLGSQHIDAGVCLFSCFFPLFFMGSVWFCVWLIVWWFFSLFVLALNFRLSHKLQLLICGATPWIFVFLCPGNSWNQLKRMCSVNVLLGELRLPRLIPTVIMRFFYLIIRFFPIPKCGFLPFSRFIAEGNAIKKSVTRFRMHQILKLHQQEIAQISEYEPLDLFSGSKEKIHKAVKALFTTPQNNFRVFLNGSLIYGGLGGGTDSTSFMVGEAFEDVLKCVIQAEVGMRVESFLHLVSETVSKSGVLDRLLEVQKLDIFDIEGAIHAYYDIVSEPCTVCRDLGEDIASHRYTSLHSIPSDESLKIVRDYLIAATAKDCSLMISFAPRKDGNSASPYSNVYLASTDQSFDYKAYFIDLDMKPLKKMQYYYELDQKIVSCYTQMMKTKHQPEKAASSGAYEATT